MMKNDFYAIQSQTVTGESLSAIIHINPEHSIFKGHFPGQPVVPGVCMVQIVKEFIEEQFGMPMLFHKGNQIKFLQLLVPAAGENVTVNVNWKTGTDGIQASADFRKNDVAVFKLSGSFRKR